MVMKMNKTQFISILSEKLNCDLDYSRKINDILEENPIFGRKNKEKITTEFINKLGVDTEEADRIYEIVSSIISTAIKDKIIHPFKKYEEK